MIHYQMPNGWMEIADTETAVRYCYDSVHCQITGYIAFKSTME